MIPSTHVPPLSQESTPQSLILLLHVKPLNPVPVQLHVYVLTPSIHWPLFKHGPNAQSSILLLHVGPLYPGAQEQVNAKFVLIFVIKNKKSNK